MFWFEIFVLKLSLVYDVNLCDILDVFVRFISMICDHFSQHWQPSEIDRLFMWKIVKKKDGKYVTIQIHSVESVSDENLLVVCKDGNFFYPHWLSSMWT